MRAPADTREMFVAGKDYMSNMDLPPSSSDDDDFSEEDGAEEKLTTKQQSLQNLSHLSSMHISANKPIRAHIKTLLISLILSHLKRRTTVMSMSLQCSTHKRWTKKQQTRTWHQ